MHPPYDRLPLDTTGRAEWATAIIERGLAAGPLPVYGSAEWASLPPNSPQAVAATVVAAECWRDAGTPETIRRTVELEILAAEQVARSEQSAAFAELAAAVRTLVAVPTQTELAKRRAVVAA